MNNHKPLQSPFHNVPLHRRGNPLFLPVFSTEPFLLHILPVVLREILPPSLQGHGNHFHLDVMVTVQ